VFPSAEDAPGPKGSFPGAPSEKRRAERRQLTIMACELVGAAALSARLDAETFRVVLEAHHRRCREVIDSHGGHIASYLPDGLIAYFGEPPAREHDAENALRAGLLLVANNLPRENGAIPHLEVRIGIASGTVIMDQPVAGITLPERAAVGEAANLAQQLKAAADPGSVIVVRSTRDLARGLFEFRTIGPVALEGSPEPVAAWHVLRASDTASQIDARSGRSCAERLDLPARSLGPFVGRGLGEEPGGDRWIETSPRRGYRFVGSIAKPDEPLVSTMARAAAPPPPDKPSIAVLPFENMSGDPEQEYFADGMVEEIITALSRFKWLFVIARNSSFTFKGKAVDTKEVGRRLGVRYVLEGSVRKASGKVRITGQLIDAVTDAHIWADRFERDLQDVFALQDEVTVAVVSAIQPKMLQTEIEMAARRRPENLTAYDLSLRARQQWYLTTREWMAETIRLAHRALELDPRFAFVAALAGHCHMLNVVLGYADDPQFDRKEAVRLLRLALGIDGGDPETLALAAAISAFMVGDCESEIEWADRAVALNPNSYFTWHFRGWVYRNAGLPEEAVRSFERAIRMSPVDPLLHRSFAGMGMALIELGRFDEAIAAGKKALRQNPSFPVAYRCLAAAFAYLGRAEAREAATRALELDPAFTISGWIARGGQSNAKLLIEGFRKAGLPE
jgi:adenylate cyclase